MLCLRLLAQAAETTSQAQPPASIVPVDTIWEYVISVNLLEALTFISFGVVCLFYGWRVFRILVTICFGLIGIYAGVKINELLVGGNGIWLGIIFMVLLALLSVPLMRWGVSLLGAAAGAAITGGAWFAFSLPEQYIWAGALVGIIAGGMISFIIFKAAVMLFTCLGGSSLVVVGVLALMYHYMDSAEQVQQFVFDYNWFLPAIIIVPMALGMFAQYKLIRSSKDWDI